LTGKGGDFSAHHSIRRDDLLVTRWGRRGKANVVLSREIKSGPRLKGGISESERGGKIDFFGKKTGERIAGREKKAK